MKVSSEFSTPPALPLAVFSVGDKKKQTNINICHTVTELLAIWRYGSRNLHYNLDKKEYSKFN